MNHRLLDKAAALSCLLLLASAAAGCDEGGAPQKPAATTASAPDSPKATATAAETAAAKATPPKLPQGRSPMPTLAEWASMREVTVKGSSALGCETKMVREYLRISCKGKNDTGGTPTTVRMTRGGHGESFMFADAGVTSLILPFVEGIDAEAIFSWTDKSHPLTLKWSRGAPKPAVIGVFEGAKSPLDGTAASGETKLCDCHKKATGQADCSEMMGGYNPDCDRTYGSDCGRLIECSRGEPSSMPTCLPGFVQAYTGFVCVKVCDPKKSECPAGQTCVDLGHTMACVED